VNVDVSVGDTGVMENVPASVFPPRVPIKIMPVTVIEVDNVYVPKVAEEVPSEVVGTTFIIVA
jgi:hypothetical protein